MPADLRLAARKWCRGSSPAAPPRWSRSVEGAEDDLAAATAVIDERRVGPDDVVVGIAASGTTPFVRAAIGRARQLGAKTVFLSCTAPPREMADSCDECITVPVGPEVVTGSTRLKAGTATKLVLNILTTGAMIRLGKTYGNLMVDLQVRNVKLADRGERIVMEVTGVDRDAARAALAAAGGSVRTAIVMVRTGKDRAASESLIADAQGRLRPILGNPPPVDPS